ncbi:Rid family detoxifying hydrolase [Cellulomonas fimi]|uniref:Endoribonuclease L-PSP n=1 Tax=Cellulomonas fimi (strain ATCC 484 / DSM 20113 / JCM 1341 / CCUG 24087 / LMG 16345 / NBRC 15513 / NCIMB 8980 / NCTC 7547 / NRS-133) TaxID=590998 RepID=F4H6B1_CELFA|nr:Rid family detoxifying hydrolase [Cellulomonas fimi]AEE44423.1 endoribonuclease L-PSP [Cellulomonas fimi ATCC 484]NNH08314.1 RidA family protein [Cellulomonas fimi]VEH26332.1 Enamine/imine deaminase [Cellulomonas fimi]
MTRTTVTAPSAPAAIGPYAHAAHGDGLLFLSGQTPIDPATGALVDGDVAVQTRRVLANLQEVLRAAGGSLDDVVKTTVYLVSMDDFAAMNAAYAEAFTDPFPARTTVAVAGLPLGARVEIEAVAARSSTP